MPDNGVNPPGAASYQAPLLNFSAIANWPNDFYQGVFNQQQQGLNQQTGQLNDAKIQQAQRTAELQKQLADQFNSGSPVDYRKIAAIMAAMGNPAEAFQVMQSQPPPLSPLLGGPQPQEQGGVQQPQPASVQARPLPPPAQNSPRGDNGQNTLTSLVTDRLPAQNQTTGATISRIAEVMGVDPNAPLTPGQQKRAQVLLKKYAPDTAGVQVTGAGTAGPNDRTASFNERFAGAGGGSNLPPSANAGSPAARVAPTPQQQPQQAAPAPQGGQPITPQVPLPPGFNDPQKAIQALRTEAVRLAQTPNGQAQARELDAYANRIEESIKPISVGAQSTIVDPRTGKVIYQGPGAAAYASGGESGTTLDADAENYRQTGKLPPNMGRGIQGAAQATRIRERAAEIETEAGGDVSAWPQRWQTFGAQASGQRVLQTRATNLRLAENEATSLIPRVREISDKINRTEYPTLNSVILAAEKGTGDPNVIKYGLAVASLIPVYARVLKPTGQITEGDTNRAREILDKAWSKGQINAALDQMELELKSAKDALQKTMDESSGSSKKKSDDTSSKSSTTPKTNVTPGGLSWHVEGQ
jgi:hypothetical protein